MQETPIYDGLTGETETDVPAALVTLNHRIIAAQSWEPEADDA